MHGSNVSICNEGYHSVYCKKCKAFLRKEHHNWQYMGWGDCVTYPGWTVSCLCDSWSTDANYTGDPEHDTVPDDHKELHEVIEEPTCTTYGRIWYVCDACHYDSRQFDGAGSIPPLGHDWGDWTTRSAATCTSDGIKTHTCDRCGTSAEESIPALGHNWGAWKTTIDATCQQDGQKVRYCETCGEDETQTVTGSHSWTYIPKTKKFQCEYCGIISNKSGDNSNLWY